MRIATQTLNLFMEENHILSLIEATLTVPTPSGHGLERCHAVASSLEQLLAASLVRAGFRVQGLGFRSSCYEQVR